MPTKFLLRTRLAAAAALGLLLVVGCGGSKKTVSVTGKLVPPAKVKIADTDSINVVFIPEGGADGKEGGIASVNAKDMTFSGTVTPGKYKIAVTITPYAGEKGEKERTKELSSAMGAFGANATPLRAEVSGDGAQSFTVDLAKSSVSKP